MILKVRITVAFVAILCYSLFSQKAMSNYRSEYWQDTFETSISFDEDSSATLWIESQSLATYPKPAGVKVTQKDYAGFVKAFLQAQNKYEEWVKVAKENNVTDLNKEMDFSCTVAGYFQYGNDWNFDSYVEINFRFLIKSEKGKTLYLLIAGTGEMESMTNKYVKLDEGLAFAFTSTDEISSFLSSISIQEIENFKKKPQKEDLFK